MRKLFAKAKGASIVALAINLAAFLYSYTVYFLVDAPVFILDITPFFISLSRYLTPFICAFPIIFSPGEKRLSLFLFPILPSLTRLLFSLPSGYIYYLGLGYDSIESVSYSLLIALAIILINYGITLGIGFSFRAYFTGKRKMDMSDDALLQEAAVSYKFSGSFSPTPATSRKWWISPGQRNKKHRGMPFLASRGFLIHYIM